jgi:hypothetical protein
MLGLFNFLRFNYTYDPNVSADGISNLPISANVRLPRPDHDVSGPSSFDGSIDGSSSSSSSSKKQKRISFSNKCKVILVPTRAEYIAAGVDLWHNEDIISENRQELKQQLESYMKESGSSSSIGACTPQLALKMVIQQNLNQADAVEESAESKEELLVEEADYFVVEDHDDEMIDEG